MRRYKADIIVSQSKIDALLVQKLKMKEDVLTRYRRLDEVEAGIDARRMSISKNLRNRGISMAIVI